MQTFVVTVICAIALVVFFLVSYSIGYGDGEEDTKVYVQQELDKIKAEKLMLKEKAEFYERNEKSIKKDLKEEKLDEIDQMVELFGYQGNKNARGDK